MTLLSARQLARELGVHPNTVKRISSSVLPFYRVKERGDRRYRREDIDAYLAARRVSAEHEHYWVDAFDDEAGWHCTTCGVTEYPEPPYGWHDDGDACTGPGCINPAHVEKSAARRVSGREEPVR